VVSVTPQPRFTPVKDLWYPLDRRVDRLIVGLDTEAREKILCLCRGSNPGHPFCSQTRTELPQVLNVSDIEFKMSNYSPEVELLQFYRVFMFAVLSFMAFSRKS
jgi:hypothetical protein